MIEVNEDSMIDFVKLLLEYNHSIKVTEDRTIVYNNEKKDPVSVEVVGKKMLPLRVFKEGDGRDGYAYVHPFKESCTNTVARSWFYHMCCANVSVLLKKLILKAVELAATKGSDDPDQMVVLQSIMKDADAEMVKEIDKMKPSDIALISYNKSAKKATLNVFHNLQETKTLYNKIRKKTWPVLDTLIGVFLDETDFENTEVLSYTATLLNIPETEAKLQVIVSALMRMAPYAKLFLDKNLKVDELEQHMKLLTGYNKLHLYLNADNTTPSMAQPATTQINPISTTTPLMVTPVSNRMTAPVVNNVVSQTRPKENAENKAPAAIPRASAPEQPILQSNAPLVRQQWQQQPQVQPQPMYMSPQGGQYMQQPNYMGGQYMPPQQYMQQSAYMQQQPNYMGGQYMQQPNYMGGQYMPPQQYIQPRPYIQPSAYGQMNQPFHQNR